MQRNCVITKGKKLISYEKFWNNFLWRAGLGTSMIQMQVFFLLLQYLTLGPHVLTPGTSVC